MTYSVTISWGKEDDAIVHYEFNTKKELEAFNRGVEADIGWSTYSVTECTGDWNN